MQGLELRGFNALRDKINEERGGYIDELDSIDLSKPNALALFAETRGRYSGLEDVLFMMDEVIEAMEKS